jgi:hypothetical protein
MKKCHGRTNYAPSRNPLRTLCPKKACVKRSGTLHDLPRTHGKQHSQYLLSCLGCASPVRGRLVINSRERTQEKKKNRGLLPLGRVGFKLVNLGTGQSPLTAHYIHNQGGEIASNGRSEPFFFSKLTKSDPTRPRGLLEEQSPPSPTAVLFQVSSCFPRAKLPCNSYNGQVVCDDNGDSHDCG